MGAVEDVATGIVAFWGVVDIDDFVAGVFEGGAFFGGEAWSLSSVQDEDSWFFVVAWIVAEFGGDVFLDGTIIAGAGAW